MEGNGRERGGEGEEKEREGERMREKEREGERRTSCGREGEESPGASSVLDCAHGAVKKTIKPKSRFSLCNTLEKKSNNNGLH